MPRAAGAHASAALDLTLNDLQMQSFNAKLHSSSAGHCYWACRVTAAGCREGPRGADLRRKAGVQCAEMVWHC